MLKKSSTFAPDFKFSPKISRDVGIGRQERLKIFCSVMSVPVRPRLAVQKTATITLLFFAFDAGAYRRLICARW